MGGAARDTGTDTQRRVLEEGGRMIQGIGLVLILVAKLQLFH